MGNQIGAVNTQAESNYSQKADYTQDLKQKMCTMKDWTVRIAQESYEKIHEKTRSMYEVVCQKTSVLYEKAKEHKKLIGAIATYGIIEVVLYMSGRPTIFNRIVFLPTELNTERINNQNLNGQLNIAQNKINNRKTKITNYRRIVTGLTNQLNTVNTVTIPNLNKQLSDIKNIQERLECENKEFQGVNQEIGFLMKELEQLKLNSNNKEVTSLIDELDAAYARNENYMDELTQEKARTKQLEEELDRVLADYEADLGKLEQAEARIIELQKVRTV
jgi:hypothetical protein